ncbi:glycerol-3-phosphate phosphatase-like [Diadema setosum]|uniref:glycerol-3-phosphate phosphatase-like n=1 Tax=Diadema setosum TaxID=31175 RepID=UPI003B3A67B7
MLRRYSSRMRRRIRKSSRSSSGAKSKPKYEAFLDGQGNSITTQIDTSPPQQRRQAATAVAAAVNGSGSRRRSNMAPCVGVNRRNIQSFLDSFDCVLFDCDDVIWNQNKPVPGTAEAIRKLRCLGKQVLFVTNNNFLSRDQILRKFQSQGHQVSKEEIFSAGYATAIYLKDVLKLQGKVYLVGSDGLEAELQACGVPCIGVGPDPYLGEEAEHKWLEEELDGDVKAVVVGHDKHFSYVKVFKAASYLSISDVAFVGTNTDESVPIPEKGKTKPGTGAFVRAIEVASCRSATTIGKPSRYLLDCIKEKYDIDPERTLMVGDRHNTDVLFGKRCGMKTMAVFTGVLSKAELTRYRESPEPEEQEYVPDFFLDSVGDLSSLIDL